MEVMLGMLEGGEMDKDDHLVETVSNRKQAVGHGAKCGE